MTGTAVRNAVRGSRALPVLAVATGLSSVLALIVPAALGNALDAILAGSGRSRAVLGLALLAFLVLMVDALGEVSEGYHHSGATRRLRDAGVQHYLNLGVTAQNHYSAGDLTTRVTGIAPQGARLGPQVVRAVAGLLRGIAAGVLLARLDPRLLGVVVLALPAGLLALTAFARETSSRVRDYQRAQTELGTRLADALAGIRTVRAAGTAEREVDRILGPLPRLSAAGRELWLGQGVLAGRAALIGPLTVVAVLLVAGPGVSAGRLSAGDFLAAAGWAPITLGLLGQVSLWTSLTRCRVALRQLDELDSPVKTSAGDRPLPDGPGRVELRDVTVLRPGRVVLDRVSLTLRPGEVTALVGRSGSGKSLLAQVAGGLLAPDGGEVRLDGTALAEIDPDRLREAVAYAFETPYLLGRTVADAVGYGREPAPSRELVVRAARTAGADRFVRKLPEGYDTPLSRTPLSGGEAQRIGLARAVIRDARLLVLDDATSGLDVATEAAAVASITATGPGRTRLVVAHRPAVAARADRVAWLEHGRLAGVGTHRELWRDPAYRAVFGETERDPEAPGD